MNIIDAIRLVSSTFRQIDDLEERVSDLEDIDHSPDEAVIASDHGYPGDGSGGDIGEFILEHLDETIVLDGAVYSLQSEIDIAPSDVDLIVRTTSSDRVRLRVDHDDVDAALRVGSWGNGISTCVLENLEIDLDGHDAGIGRFFVDDHLDVSDVSLRGRRDRYNKHGDKYSYLACITSPDGLGIHRRVCLPDGDTWTGDDEHSHAIGIAADPPHVGTQLWVNCHVAEHWDNGFYIRNSPDGVNVLLSPRAENCGRCNIRLGARDVAIEPTSIWDLDLKHDHYPEGVGGGRDAFGTLLASDGDGAMVIGGKAIARTGRNDLVRTWGDAGRFTMIGTEIVNETDQWAIRASVGEDGDDTAIARITDCTIRERCDTAIRGAAVSSWRDHLVLEGVSYVNEGDTQSRAFLEAADGCSVTVRESYIESGCDSVVRLRDSPDRIVLDHCEINGGVDLGEGESVEVLQLTHCDARDVGQLWTGSGGENDVAYLSVHSSPGLEEYRS
ncbi:hypothetical protein [Natrinema gelatinilyticum]|uniref:hypothetical protein n=1 Tax=Natrinema gelatinilyticum TaxID=2961571 RepID=UPI0020C23CB4|nr:hypothetical protein [Natrinema gelatinilyticum]